MTRGWSKGLAPVNDLAANILVCVGIGWVIQRYWPGTKPWGYVGGTLLGTVAGFWQIYKREVKRAKKPPLPGPKDGNEGTPR